VTAGELRHEAGIVWLENIGDLDYVRESLTWVRTRERRPLWPPGRLVGYAVLDSRAPSHEREFLRRVFWLKVYDRDSGNPVYSTGAPVEAVDPRTVRPGVPGRLTTRAWGRRLRCATERSPEPNETAKPKRRRTCPRPSGLRRRWRKTGRRVSGAVRTEVAQ